MTGTPGTLLGWLRPGAVDGRQVDERGRVLVDEPRRPDRGTRGHPHPGCPRECPPSSETFPQVNPSSGTRGTRGTLFGKFGVSPSPRLVDLAAVDNATSRRAPT